MVRAEQGSQLPSRQITPNDVGGGFALRRYAWQ